MSLSGPDTIEAKMKQVRSVFGGDEEDGDPDRLYELHAKLSERAITKAGNALGELL